MGTESSALASGRIEAFSAIEEPVATAAYVSRRVASNEEAETVFSYAISKHKKALEELAKYDRT